MYYKQETAKQTKQQPRPTYQATLTELDQFIIAQQRDQPPRYIANHAPLHYSEHTQRIPDYIHFLGSWGAIELHGMYLRLSKMPLDQDFKQVKYSQVPFLIQENKIISQPPKTLCNSSSQQWLIRLTMMLILYYIEQLDLTLYSPHIQPSLSLKSKNVVLLQYIIQHCNFI